MSQPPKIRLFPDILNRQNTSSDKRVPVPGILSTEAFIEHLNIERMRVDRSGSTFALIVFTLEGLYNISQRQRAEEVMMEVLKKRTRACDAKGWRGSDPAVILPYTTKANASAVIAPLSELFRETASKIVTLPASAGFSCIVYGYPEDDLTAIVQP